MRSLDLDDTNSLPQTLKLNSTKCLSQDVCELVSSANEIDSHSSIFDAASDEMIPHLDVFASVMEHWVLA